MNARTAKPFWFSTTFVVVAVLFGSALHAAETKPAKPRGGYGSEATAPAPPAGDTSTTARTTTPPAQNDDWLPAAEKRVAAVVDFLNQRADAARAAWADVPKRLDARAHAVLRELGFTAGDIAKYYRPPEDLNWFTMCVDRFYAGNAAVVARIDVRRIGNPPDILRGEPLHAEGNRRAVQNALAALEGDLALFTFYDELLQRHLAAALEHEAQMRALFARRERNSAQIDEVGKQFDYDKSYGDPTNAAARAKMRPLRREKHWLLINESNWRNFQRPGANPNRISYYGMFARCDWLASAQDAPVFTRTDKLVPLAVAARRIEAHLTALDERVAKLTGTPEVQQWDIDARSYLDFYRRESTALEDSLARLLALNGASAADLDRIDEQMRASESAELVFAQQLRRFAGDAQRDLALDYQLDDIGGAIADAETAAWKLRQAGNFSAANDAYSRADPFREQAEKLREQRTRNDAGEREILDAARERDDALNFVTPIPGGRVRHVRLEVAVERQPFKFALPTQPLKGAPVEMSVARSSTEIVFGVPLIAVVEWEPEDKAEPPLEQSIELELGGRTVILTARKDPYAEIYRSDAFVLKPPSVAGTVVP